MTHVAWRSAFGQRCALSLIAMVLLFGLVFALQPRALSYGGLGLLLGMSIPIVLVALAQMFIMALGDLDLSIGSFVSLVACIVVTLDPLWAATALLVAVLGYAAVGALIAWRHLPALVVTLGLSFVWAGFAMLVRPSPGGEAAAWLVNLMNADTPLVPVQVWMAVAAGLLGYGLLWHTKQGLLIRATGGNALALRRAGWSVVRARMCAYALAGVCGVLAGVSLAGIATSADPGIATRYTLISLTAVVLGGGELSGGRVTVLGAVAGAYVIVLADALLSFLGVSANWQIAAQGLILLFVLALRMVLRGSSDAKA